MMDMLTTLDEYSIKATSSDYEKMKHMIDLNGMKWVECPGEAEYIGVDMVSYGIVDYVMSNDSDCIACLCEKYITNFNWERETYSLIDIRGLLHSMRITPNLFRVACCCMGNDYMESVWENGSYWGRIRSYIMKYKLYDMNRVTELYPEHKDRIEYCWNLYCRTNRLSENDIRMKISGNGRVSPRKIEEIRLSGMCV